MDIFRHDLRYAIRGLGKAPLFSLISILTLALGIAASTAIFSIVKAVLLEPLPYRDGERLVLAVRSGPGLLKTIASYPDFTDWQGAGMFEQSAAVTGRGFFLELPEGPLPLAGRRVSAEFFEVLRVQPLLGRLFLPDDDLATETAAVISHGLWTAQLGRDAQIVGKSLRLRGQVVRVIGVLPPDFVDPISPLAQLELYVPLIASPAERVARNSQWLQVIGRLRDGIALEQAAAQVQILSQRAIDEQQSAGEVRALDPFTLIKLRDHHVGEAKAPLWMLLGAVAFVLLIGCVNVSNLQLTRLLNRRNDLAVRVALGASARQLRSHLLAESLLLASASGALGLLVMLWLLETIQAFTPIAIPGLEGASLDLGVLAFAAVVAGSAGLFVGMLPILRGFRPEDLPVPRQTSGTAGTVDARLRGTLLTLEITLTVVLLVGAMLTITSFVRLLRVDRGFQVGNIVTINLTYAGEQQQAQQWAFFDQLIQRIRVLPGVQGAGVVDNLPFSGAWSQYTTRAEDFARDARPEMIGHKVELQQSIVAGDYFRVMGIPLKAGRLFDDHDYSEGKSSVLISESLARLVWGNSDPVGRRVKADPAQASEVIGVVGDVRHFGPESTPVPTLYRPLAQRAAWGGTLVALTDRDAPALLPTIRDIVRGLDPAMIVRNSQSMSELLQARTAMPRFLAVLFGAFSGMALILAAGGIYGVIAYATSQRTREIGVRLALGAQPAAVRRMVLRSALRVAAGGTVTGLLGAFALSRYLQSQLFEISPTDPAVYVVAALLAILVTLLASDLPARRAARLDPIAALRYE